VFRSSFWQRGVFWLVVAACLQFVVLTAVAMLFYAGSVQTAPVASGYSFFRNFFSDLGMTQTRAGQSNTVSAVLFLTALTLAGGGLVLFFVAFTQFFAGPLLGKVLSWLGSIFGIVAGLCFVGVAFTPVNLYGPAHARFVLWAFQAFPVAVILYVIAILCERGYPKRFALVFIAFAVLLIAYLFLLTRGPSPRTAEELVIQATGQKVIVYASIISILLQALGALKVGQRASNQRRATSNQRLSA
jgi:hypothetical membrane protein